MRQCRAALVGAADKPYVKACREDAYTYVGLVRQFGQAAFDADVAAPGTRR